MVMNKSIWVAVATLTLFFTWTMDRGAIAYDGEGANYVSPDRTKRYSFRAKIAEYEYLYPQKRIKGQSFPPAESDQIPNASTGDCSDSAFRCVSYDYQAFAVPRKGLAPNDTYVAAGNTFDVVQCVRGYGNVCQVALIRDKCYHISRLDTCDPAEERDGVRQTPWLMYFVYNEDFGVTSYGIAPSASVDAPIDAAAAFAKKYILVGDNGLLKP